MDVALTSEACVPSQTKYTSVLSDMCVKRLCSGMVGNARIMTCQKYEHHSNPGFMLFVNFFYFSNFFYLILRGHPGYNRVDYTCVCKTTKDSTTFYVVK